MNILRIGTVVVTGLLLALGRGRGNAVAEPAPNNTAEGPVKPAKPIKFFYFEQDEKENLGELKYKDYQKVILPELLRLNPKNKNKAATSAIRGIGDAVTFFNLAFKDLEKTCITPKNLMPPMAVVKTVQIEGKEPDNGFPLRVDIPKDLNVSPDSIYYSGKDKSQIVVVATDKDGNNVFYTIPNDDCPIVIINNGQAILIIPEDQIKSKKPDPGKINSNQPTRWQIEKEFKEPKRISLS